MRQNSGSLVMAPEMTPVKSSNIAAIGHDGSHLHVRFNSGQTWRYPATADEHAALLGAKSIGAHFHANIKPRGGEKVG